MASLIIYTFESCPTCRRAKADMDREGIAYEEKKCEDAANYEEALELGLFVPIVVQDGKVTQGWRGDYGCAIQ